MQDFNEMEFSLTERIVCGDVAAFDEMFRRCYSSLLSYALQIVDAKDAEDVVQDVFVWVWSHRKMLPAALGGAKLRYYLLRSVYNGCLNKKRHTDVDSTSREWFRWRMEQAYTAYDPDNDPVIRKLYSEDLSYLVHARKRLKRLHAHVAQVSCGIAQRPCTAAHSYAELACALLCKL